MPRPSVEDLADTQRYQRVAVFRHHEPSGFLRDYFHAYLGHPSTPIWIFYALNAAALGLMGFEWFNRRLGMDGVARFGFGALLAFALMPLHEGLHGLAYKVAGARDVRYRFLWKRLMAYAIAHRFVAGKREFFWTAILPTLVINPVLLALAFTTPADQRLTWLSALFVHVAFASGDFALINFFHVHGSREPWTFDDADEETSYFFESLKPAAG